MNKLEAIKIGLLKNDNNRKFESQLIQFIEILKFKKFDELCGGRYSSFFIFLLFVNWMANRDELDFILLEIENLELGKNGRSLMKRETRFKGMLSNLWHKHYLVPSVPSVMKNVQVELTKDKTRKKKTERIYKLINENPNISKEKSLNIFIDNLLESTFTDRQRNSELTGEWIVYAKHCDKNYYLALQTHKKIISDGTLLQQLRMNCKSEFPFLKI